MFVVSFFLFFLWWYCKTIVSYVFELMYSVNTCYVLITSHYSHAPKSSLVDVQYGFWRVTKLKWSWSPIYNHYIIMSHSMNECLCPVIKNYNRFYSYKCTMHVYMFLLPDISLSIKLDNFTRITWSYSGK